MWLLFGDYTASLEVYHDPARKDEPSVALRNRLRNQNDQSSHMHPDFIKVISFNLVLLSDVADILCLSDFLLPKHSHAFYFVLSQLLPTYH